MGAIRVVDYDPAWPALFEAERAGIAALLGGLVADIHHIGSTSVPGLAAKPKIDIDAVVVSEAALPPAVEIMRPQGYAFHGDPYGQGTWTFTTGKGSYGTRLYLCAPGNPVHERRILFRNHLRAHAAAAAEYAALKRRLAVEAKGDWSAYTGGKADFVARIVALAAAQS